MKKLISMLLAVMLTAILSSPVYADTVAGLEPGQAMPDFTVSLTDGSTATLSEVLEEKDLVVLNIFASWCGPCEIEFPEMEKVWETKKDHMEIIAVSGYPNDTMEIIDEYKKSHELTFPMGLAGDALGFIELEAYPTTIFIDRNGNVGLVKVGAFVTREDFEEKVDLFLSEDYDGNPLKSEKAINISSYLYLWLMIGGLLSLIGRWRMFRKAGKPGWNSLIPILNTYREFSICWNGWFGVIADLCIVAGFINNLAGLPAVIYYILLGVSFLFSILEGFKLAGVFGKGKVFGLLLALPVAKDICRFILGVTKAEYRPVK